MESVFDPLEFLAEITRHIPAPGMQMVRYYGGTRTADRRDTGCRTGSNEAPAKWQLRAQRAKIAESATQAAAAAAIENDDEDTHYRKLCRIRWVALIKRGWDSDPRLCPSCDGAMKIVALCEAFDYVK